MCVDENEDGFRLIQKKKKQCGMCLTIREYRKVRPCVRKGVEWYDNQIWRYNEDGNKEIKPHLNTSLCLARGSGKSRFAVKTRSGMSYIQSAL